MEIESAKRKILITGLPGVGKTTLFVHLYKELKALHPAGFYTSEIRENNVRKGFELVGLNGRRSVLSHVNVKSSFRVGKYGVDVSGFEDFLDSIDFRNPDSSLIMIDEIGKMECLSNKFRKLIKDLLDSEKSMIATIAHKGGGIMAEIKNHENTTMFEVTRSNRNNLMTRILELIRK